MSSEVVVVLHAHPDDEAIFTGGTIAALAEAGHRVVVLIATSGELGVDVATGPDRRALLAARRRDEATVACDRLGAARLVFLDHIDSGLERDRAARPWGAFADVELETAAEQVAALAIEEGATSLVTYDESGIYGHPDHVHAHHVGRRAVELAQIPTRYDVTVDREYLHFVDTHVVGRAAGSPPSAGAWGLPTVEITTTLDVRRHLEAKRDAIAAHGSQLDGDVWLGVRDGYDQVYGYEWFVRTGPPGPIERLINEPARAAGAAR